MDRLNSHPYLDRLNVTSNVSACQPTPDRLNVAPLTGKLETANG